MSTKSEKQLIDAKIAKVREIVRNVSNNDIVLALHNFDMDVNRTIQALTTDIDSALGEWEKKGGSVPKSSKQKKKNKGNAAVADSSSATSTTTETPKVSSVNSRPATTANPPQQRQTAPPTQQQAPVKKPDPAVTKAFGQLGEEEKRSELEALIHELDIKSARVQKNIDNAYSEQSAVILSIQTALNARERNLIGHLEASRQQVESKVQQQRATIQKLKQNPKAAADEFARLKADQASLDALLETNFTVHGDKAIKAIEKLGSGFLPAEAVSYHAPPVVHVQSNGTPQVQKNAQQSAAHHQPQLNGHQQNGKPAQQPPKQQNGKPSKPLNGTDIKHSVSHSSLAASEENDSGLGQVSPVSHEKNVAQVADGGFLFASDGLDASQLAKIKAQVAETLKAQGIDPNILASIASSDSGAATRPRHRPPRKDNANGKPAANKENKKSSGGKAVKS